MLSDQIKETLLAIKFREQVFELLDTVAADHPVRIFISHNKAQPQSRLDKPFGVVYSVDSAKASSLVADLNQKLLNGYRVYEISDGTKLTDLAVIRPTDKYELVRIMGTNAEEKHNLDTGTLVARLRRWEEEYGLEILGAGENWVKFRMEKIPGNLRDFVNELTEFAPATLTNQTIKDIEAVLKDSRFVHIRW